MRFAPLPLLMLGGAGLFGCSLILGTQEIEVQNDSDSTVVVVLGTVGTGKVPAHTTGVVRSEQGTKSDIIQILGDGIPETLCDWSEVRDRMPIVVTNEGAQC